MNKYQEWKQAVKNPPPERLAKVEYQSHLFQAFGITFVSIILIVKGFWYIMFAFIFGLGISYSAGMSAYIKYTNIMALIKPEHFKEYDRDLSPTRRRDKIITHVFGKSSKWFALIMGVVISFVILGNQHSRITLSLLYPITSIIFYLMIYFFLFYWISYPIYKSQVKTI